MTRNKKPKDVEFPADSCANCTFCFDVGDGYDCVAEPAHIAAHDEQGEPLYTRGKP